MNLKTFCDSILVQYGITRTNENSYIQVYEVLRNSIDEYKLCNGMIYKNNKNMIASFPTTYDYYYEIFSKFGNTNQLEFTNLLQTLDFENPEIVPDKFMTLILNSEKFPFGRLFMQDVEILNYGSIKKQITQIYYNTKYMTGNNIIYYISNGIKYDYNYTKEVELFVANAASIAEYENYFHSKLISQEAVRIIYNKYVESNTQFSDMLINKITLNDMLYDAVQHYEIIPYSLELKITKNMEFSRYCILNKVVPFPEYILPVCKTDKCETNNKLKTLASLWISVFKTEPPICIWHDPTFYNVSEKSFGKITNIDLKYIWTLYCGKNNMPDWIKHVTVFRKQFANSMVKQMNTSDSILLSNSDEHCYLIQLQSDRISNFSSFKIGKSIDILTRMRTKEYQHARIICIMQVNNCTECENEIKRIFNAKFAVVPTGYKNETSSINGPVEGNEHFVGDVSEIRYEFINICNSFWC
jgi:hypothetical protein